MPTRHQRLKVTLPHIERILLRAISLRATRRSQEVNPEKARVPDSECIRRLIRDTAVKAGISDAEFAAAEDDLGRHAPEPELAPDATIL
jgi:hypothetical protein